MYEAPPYLPLRGVRVLAFETAYSLPAGTRTLAELGAEVVRVASPSRGFGVYISVVDGVFLSKKCIGIDLRDREGLSLAKRLICVADVVASNFTADVMPRFGLGPEDLLRMKPDLIVLQLTGYGVPGPWQDYPAYGPSVEAAGGMNRLSGNENDPPVRVGSGVFADQLSGRFAALALVAALRRRRETGRGQYIDVSMYESIVTLLGHFMLNAARSGRAMPPRRGNRDAAAAPQGIYPCAGEDEWVALSIRSDAEWRAFAALAGGGLEDARFASIDGRLEAQDELDDRIARWTRPQDKVAVAESLQAVGVAAGPVNKVSDFPFDPHLAARGFFQTVEHGQPMYGHTAHPHPTTPWVAEGRSRARLRDIRFAGVDNEAVLGEWLSIPPEEVAALEADGALLRASKVETTEPNPAPGAPHDADFARRLGLPAAGADMEAAT
ncbi:MAG TPA: CoA transferase [Dehalococcoidia bacterium]|nr:CoA transferase [Dehalococcoidia bacterium]